MQDFDDLSLLRQYTEQNSEEAFAALVSRHINKVYSVALRHTRNPHSAEEIAQAVFVILARKSPHLGKRVVLSGWLYETSRLTAVTHVRGEIRRARREQEAHMQSLLNKNDADLWPQIAPLLDAAIAGLSETDRQAVVLRFFDGKSIKEVGAALGASEDAAKMRLNRAVEKLRGFFTKRGVVLPAATLMAAISAHSVQAAPAALAKNVTAVAIANGATASLSTSTLIKGALKIMAWTNAKTALVVGMGVLLAAATTTITIKEIQEHRTYPWQVKIYDAKVLEAAPPQVRLLPAKYPLAGGGWGVRNGKIMGLGLPVKHVIQAAYAPTYGSRHLSRIISTTELPQGNYDMIASLPTGNAQALQQEIARKLGVVAKLETRDTEVLLLTVKSLNAPGLKASTHHEAGGVFSNDKLNLSGADMDSLRFNLEEYFEIPVMDRTGLAGNFDLTATWTTPDNRKNPEALKAALVDQLGLELVPTNMPLQMLVMEKAK